MTPIPLGEQEGDVSNKEHDKTIGLPTTLSRWSRIKVRYTLWQHRRRTGERVYAIFGPYIEDRTMLIFDDKLMRESLKKRMKNYNPFKTP